MTGSHPTLQPGEARAAVSRLVDDATARLGGGWSEVEGPRLGTCVNERGEGEGVNYTYIRRRDDLGDAESDVAVVEQRWQEVGLATERFRSPGDDPIIGINAVGGDVVHLGYTAAPGGPQTVSATSVCAVGDYVEMRLDGKS